jgi:serine protease AprX
MRPHALLSLGAAVACLGASTSALAATPTPAAPATVRVVVTGTSAAAQGQVLRAIAAAGGRVTRPLGVVAGAGATVRADRLAALRTAPGVRSVSVDAHGRLQGVDSTLGYDVAGDEGSLYDIGQITHAKDAWAKGWTGKGVDVALIDSGTAPVKGLTSGNVLDGPDLSFESQAPGLQHLDTFGHGTHMAAIIAGRDVASSGSSYAKADSHAFNGIAPDARIVSLKVAAADGGCDVSQVIAAIDWVTQHAHQDGLNIRVLNLSYGTDSVQDPLLDPLDFAVENAWKSGIAVVVSSGNDGTNRAALADPANDPLVLAVGADDPNNTDSVGDDTVPSWTQLGTAQRHADLIAPGVHVLGLRNPGSSIDLANPSARVGTRFFRGSGTSQAAAVVSGLSALYLQKYPAATPDQVKKALTTYDSVPSSVKASFPGVGVPDVNKALSNALPSQASSAQAGTGATGLGSLEAARGTHHVDNGVAALVGEVDIFGNAWNASSWATASASGNAWNGGTWNGSAWSGSAWSGNAWNGNAWNDTDWSGNAWNGHAWSSHVWTGNGWDGNSWNDSSWTGNSWNGSAWSGSAWSTSVWQTTGWQ